MKHLKTLTIAMLLFAGVFTATSAFGQVNPGAQRTLGMAVHIAKDCVDAAEDAGHTVTDEVRLQFDADGNYYYRVVYFGNVIYGDPYNNRTVVAIVDFDAVTWDNIYYECRF